MTNDRRSFGRRVIVDRRQREARQVAIGAALFALFLAVGTAAAGYIDNPGAAAVLALGAYGALIVAAAASSEA